jgi:hypothetical protein
MIRGLMSFDGLAEVYAKGHADDMRKAFAAIGEDFLRRRTEVTHSDPTCVTEGSDYVARFVVTVRFRGEP